MNHGYPDHCASELLEFGLKAFVKILFIGLASDMESHIAILHCSFIREDYTLPLFQ
jgi:hypothetical protein